MIPMHLLNVLTCFPPDWEMLKRSSLDAFRFFSSSLNRGVVSPVRGHKEIQRSTGHIPHRHHGDNPVLKPAEIGHPNRDKILARSPTTREYRELIRVDQDDMPLSTNFKNYFTVWSAVGTSESEL